MIDSAPTLLGRVVVSLDKALYGNNLCLVALNKQQINWEEVKESTGKLENR